MEMEQCYGFHQQNLYRIVISIYVNGPEIFKTVPLYWAHGRTMLRKSIYRLAKTRRKSKHPLSSQRKIWNGNYSQQMQNGGPRNTNVAKSCTLLSYMSL